MGAVRAASVLMSAALLLCGCAGTDEGAVPADATNSTSTGAPAGSPFEKAEQYLQRRGADLDPLLTYVLILPEHRFGLTWTSAQRDEALARSEETPLLRLLGRLDGELTGTAGDIDALDPAALDSLTMSALHCYRFPEHAPAIEQLSETAAAGGYSTTHAALALGWMFENGCTSPEAVPELLADLRSRLDAIVSQRGPDDVGIEALLMLSYLGFGELVGADRVNALVAAQNPDGGWGESPGRESADHPTVLAFAVLAEASGRPRTPGTGWIDRGSEQDPESGVQNPSS